MNKMAKISKIVLLSCLIGFLGTEATLSAAQTVPAIKLRGNIDMTGAPIPLKGGVNIDNKNQKISISLRDSDVRQVLRMIADKAGLNIIFHDSVTGKVTLDLMNVNLNKAFEYVMTLNNLTYWMDNNTLVIAPKDSASKLGINKTEIKPIKIKYLDAATVAKFLNTNIFSLNRPDISTNPIVVTNPATNEVLIFGNSSDVVLAQKVINYMDIKPNVKNFTVNFIDPSTAASMICNTVFKMGSESGSGASTASSASASSSAASSTDLGDAEDLGQTACGNTSLSSEGGDLSSLGVSQFSVLYNPGLGNIIIYGGTKEQLDMASDLLKQIDKKQPQVYIEISIVELSESGSKSLQSSLLGQSGATSVKYTGTTTRFEYGSQNLTSLSGVGDLLTNLDSYGGFRYFMATLETLIQKQKGRVLANPRILATNNRTSTVNISSDFVRSRKVESSIVGNTKVDQITYDISDSGIKFDILPKISPKGYVYLNIKPSYTSQKEQVKDGTDIIATLLNKRELDMKNIRIKDGETLVLGGLIQEVDSNSKTKIPVLSDIPVIGPFFSSSVSDRSRSELIIMITPKILKDEDSVSTI